MILPKARLRPFSLDFGEVKAELINLGNPKVLTPLIYFCPVGLDKGFGLV